MSRKKMTPDLVLRLKGLEVPNGTLGSEDLSQLAKLLKGLEAASPELAGGYLVGMKSGSTCPEVRFPRKVENALPGMHLIESSLMGIFENGGYSQEIGWQVPKAVRESLRHWSQRGVTVSVNVPRVAGETYRYRFTPKVVRQFSEFIAEEPERKIIKGRLRALDGADSEFELHFDGQKLICPFPQGPRPTGLYYEKAIEAVVWVKSRPVQGPWKAVSTESIRLLPEPPHLEMENAPQGMIAPTNKLAAGFHLDEFFNGATRGDIEALCSALALSDE